MGPEILSSTGAGAWSKALVAFPDSSSALDKLQSATQRGFMLVQILRALF